VVAGAVSLGASEIHETAPLYTRIVQSVAIPAEVNSHGLFVNVLVNGRGPFRMLVDTGCTCSMISPEVAAAVEARGMEPGDEGEQALNGFGDAIALPRVLLDSITVGSVQFEGVVAGVVPLEVQSKIDSRELDGLLGYTLFSDLYFALDYPGRKLLLSQEWPENLQPVRAELPVKEHSDVPFVSVTLQREVLAVMVDTGASNRLHLPPQVTSSLDWKVVPRPGLLVAVAGEMGREQVGRLFGTLELGAVKQLEPVVDVGEGPADIGTGLLHSFSLVFHESEDKMWLCSEDAGPLPSPPERTIGLSMVADPGGWRVVGIIPDSPAAGAAIQKDELVTEIEGHPAQEWTRDQLQAWIDTHESVVLKIAGASIERQVNLRVWSLVP